MKTTEVMRTHTSPYQAKDFQVREKDTLEKIPGIKYVSSSLRPQILITNTHTNLNEISPELLNSVELIVHPNSGYDHFAQDQQLWKNIPVVIGHEIRAQAVAEYTLRSLFEGAVEFPQHLSWDQNRNWERPLLKEMPVWIFGYGHIGKILATTLHALGVKVTIVDPFIKDCPYAHLRNWKEGKLSEARAVLLAMGLNEKSRGLLNEEFFQNCHSELILINGARGKLIQEDALKSFLISHPKAYAFLDVFEKEPFGNEWHHFPQVWKTSHIAGVDANLDTRILQFEVKVISDWKSLGQKEFMKKYKNEILQNKIIDGVLV